MFVLRNAIHWPFVFVAQFTREAEIHEECVLARVLVILAHDFGGLEVNGPEELLCDQVGFTYCQRDPCAAMAGGIVMLSSSAWLGLRLCPSSIERAIPPSSIIQHACVTSSGGNSQLEDSPLHESQSSKS